MTRKEQLVPTPIRHIGGCNAWYAIEVGEQNLVLRLKLGSGENPPLGKDAKC